MVSVGNGEEEVDVTEEETTQNLYGPNDSGVPETRTRRNRSYQKVFHRCTDRGVKEFTNKFSVKEFL